MRGRSSNTWNARRATELKSFDPIRFRCVVVVVQGLQHKGDEMIKAVNVAFFLSMPACPSWNGRWSGEGRKYVIVKRFTTAKGGLMAAKILAEGSYWYSWSDGWGANIEVQQVDGLAAGKLRKESDGFSGYDWMVDSIVSYGRILADHQIEPYLETLKEVGVTP
jgi:hypothetical protein